MGEDNGGEPGGRASGRREINWDDIPDELAAPSDHRGDIFNASFPPRSRGVIMTTPGNNFMVSAGSNNPSGAAVRFGNLNPTYPQIFKAFSDERIFAPEASNLFEIRFYVPGTTTPALLRGFGAVFADVDGTETFVECFDGNGKSLGQFIVPAADNNLSFLSITFDEPLIALVRVKLGNAPLGVEDGNGYDVVAMDDIIYSEPQAVAGALVSASQPKKVGQAIRPTDAIVATATTTGTQEMGVGNEVIATEMPVSEVTPDEFLLNFDDAGEKRLASLSVDLTGLPPAPEGKTYVVWLADYNHNYLLAGEAIPGQVFIYVEPGGKNLISRFRGAVLSLEDREALQANSIQAPTEIHYTGEIPAEILPLIQKLVVAAPDTPGNNPYGYGLQEQAAIGKHHAEVLVEALKGGDLAAAKTHMEHLWNTMVGFHSPDYGDMNGDGKAENYGDGFGTLLYAARVVSILDQITELQGLNDHYRQGAVKAAQCTRSIANKLGPEIKEKGRTIFTATEADSAIQVGEVIVSAVDTLALGFDVDGNGTVDPAEGECGAAQVYDLVHRLYHIHMAHDTQGQHEH